MLISPKKKKDLNHLLDQLKKESLIPTSSIQYQSSGANPSTQRIELLINDQTQLLQLHNSFIIVPTNRGFIGASAIGA
jgi:hypothetical protein